MRKRSSIKGANSLILLIINYSLFIFLQSCSSTKHITGSANTLIADSAITNAHIGICVYNATDDKYLYNYQSDKYFIPASNTKIATCYIAMKHLGDSLVGLRYRFGADSSIIIYPTGDPTLLHPDFTNQPVYSFLKIYSRYPLSLYLGYNAWNEDAWGVGWSWDDYNDDYMAERSAFPVYGNVVKFQYTDGIKRVKNGQLEMHSANINAAPGYFTDSITKDEAGSISVIPQGANVLPFRIKRLINTNRFITLGNPAKNFNRDIPFVTNNSETAIRILQDTLNLKSFAFTEDKYPLTKIYDTYAIHSQPTDSLLKIMMHRSDNFYAEQSLLMVSNEMLGTMNDEKIVDTLLKTDFKDLPQRPQWVDGSGLSRFNLFSPQDFVLILKKMRDDYSWNRITTIFETGGTGTLKNYYTTLTGKIYAKTGSLSNNIALSGYLLTPKNKVLIFSVLVNNHTASAAKVRRAVERYLVQLQKEN